ncbi:MAG: hypothetical protein IIT32_01660, partial [Bacteroidales bacterium]|nr:hypothetical protein [Bacteroidales bacterium]
MNQIIDYQIPSRKSISYVVVVLIDLLIIGATYFGMQHFFPKLVNFDYSIYWWFGCYVLSIFLLPPLAYRRIARIDLVMLRSGKTALLMALLYFCFNRAIDYPTFSKSVLLMLAVLVVGMILSRWIGSAIVAALRRRHIDNCEVVFSGAGVNLRKLYDAMSDQRIGYHIHGYFENKESRNLGDVLPRLGDVKDTIDYLKKHKVDMLVCNIGTDRVEEISPIMDYCENNFIKFYTVP